MKKFSTYLLVMLMVVFWIVRIIVTISSELGRSFMDMVPMNETFEIVILFATLICLILVAKRKLIGCLLYLTLHAIYFGGDVTKKIAMISTGTQLSFADYTQFVFSIIGIILPIAVLIDFLFDESRKDNPHDKKTDWFYNNKEFDRKLDDRADKNNYKMY